MSDLWVNYMLMKFGARTYEYNANNNKELGEPIHEQLPKLLIEADDSNWIYFRLRIDNLA